MNLKYHPYPHVAPAAQSRISYFSVAVFKPEDQTHSRKSLLWFKLPEGESRMAKLARQQITETEN